MSSVLVVEFESADTLDDPFERLLLGALAAVLLFNPFSMGANRPWSEFISLSGIAVLSVLFAWRLISRREVRFVWSWAYVPMAVFVGWALLQMASLPADWLKALSPLTVSNKTYLLSDLPGAAERLKHLSIAYYHEEGWHLLRILAGVIAVFVVTLNITRGLLPLKLLLWAIAVIGTAEAMLGIAQNVTGATGVYWLIPLWGNMRPDAGSFLNHNYFAQFVNLSSGAALGLLLMTVDQTFRRHDYTPAEVLEKLTSRDFRPAWILTAMLTVNAGSIFLSMSRGGMIAMVAAGLIVGTFLAIRGGTRGMGIGGWGAAMLLMGAFGIVAAGGSDLVEARIRKIRDVHDQYNRLQMTRDTIRIWKDYPLTGIGLGSYRFVFPKYDHTVVQSVATHAEDDYAELLAETGAVGAGCAGAFVLMIGGCFFRAWTRGRKSPEPKSPSNGPAGRTSARSGSRPMIGEVVDVLPSEFDEPTEEFDPTPGRRRKKKKRRSAHTASAASSLALGLSFGLLAVLLQSATDFSQHHLGAACLTSACCAIMVNLAWLRRKERGLVPERGPAQGNVIYRSSALVIFAGVFGLVLAQGYSVWAEAQADGRIAEILGRIREANGEQEQGDPQDMAHFRAMMAAERPGDVIARFWSTMARADLLLNAAGPTTVPEMSQAMSDNTKRKQIEQIHDDLNDARWVCPTYGPMYSQLGQWEGNLLNRMEDSDRHLKMSYELAPTDSSVVFVYAGMLGDHGDWPGSVAAFKRAAVLDPSSLEQAIDIYLNYFHRPDLALQVAGESINDLHGLAKLLREKGKDPPTTSPATQPGDEAIAKAADKRVDEVVQRAADDPHAPAVMLAELAKLYVSRDQAARALPYFARALALEYGNVDWRLAYADALEKTGQPTEAIRQARLVLLLRPKQPDAVDLVDRLSAPPGEKRPNLH